MEPASATFRTRLNIPWLIRMAWRDSRRNRSRLFLFIASIVLGIAALVAIFSFGYDMKRSINGQARTLVGADLAIESRGPADAAIQPLLDSLGDEKAQERAFASMVYFVKNAGTRLVQVRALEGNYPFYGNLETTPAGAGRHFQSGRCALVDKTLMLQYNARVGDSIRIGSLSFVIAGSLDKAPGRTGISTTVAPPVYIPLHYLPQTGLLQRGSMVRYSYYYKYDSPVDMDGLVKTIGPRLEKAGMDYETVALREQRTGRSFEDFTRFLTLISFVALLLGCIGVASSIHIYVREKINSIAILRCLGVRSPQAFGIYGFQVAGIGLAGSVIGAGLGVLIQQVLPVVLKDFLPVEAAMTVSGRAIGYGIALGLVISVLFALLPLISVRKISPLYTLRLSFEPAGLPRDPWKAAVYAGILLFIVVFARWQTGDWRPAIVFTAGLLLAFLLLAAVARLLMWAVRRFFPRSWSYLWRQGLANLYRPHNQTLILVVTIGLGAAFIGTLYFIQGVLINRVSMAAGHHQPNMVLFDIQTGQEDSVAALTRQYGLPVLQQVPIVTMRMEAINGKTAADLRDSTDSIPRRAFEGELRCTYRDSLTSSEELIAGRLWGPVHPNETVHISMEERWARHLHVTVGDSILFNVQGMMVPTVIGSLRKVDWARVGTNFRVIFPPGVLESAPQFHVLITRVPNSAVSARFQQAMVRRYPNVSIIDLRLILSVLDDVLDKIGFVIRFMAGFSIITGIVVLIASVLISKYQRIQESVLLRTLGAGRRQILVITILEYFFLGVLAAATGILLALAASALLAKYNFDSSFSPPWQPILILPAIISLLTIGIGLFNSRGVLNKPPLEVLRREV